jgi:hypothetical protein
MRAAPSVHRAAAGRRSTMRLLAFVVALSTLVSARPAGAIVNGQPTNDYAAVGTVVFKPNGGDQFNLCSGFLISSTAFVTAGHCANEALGLKFDLGGDIGVSMDADFNPQTSVFVQADTVTVHPDFVENSQSYKTPDVAVMVLRNPVPDAVPIDLPTVGTADTLRHGDHLVTVGYGFTQTCTSAPGRCEVAYDPRRRYATEFVDSVSQWFLTVQQGPGLDSGGTCLGDSGGPHLLPDTNTVVAITTAVSSRWCWSTSRDIRLDTPAALGFLKGFLD